MSDLGLTYLEAMHALQSAVAYKIQMRLNEGHQPKHLRVGVDSAMLQISALVSVLAGKGVFTIEEYEEALRLAVNDEVSAHETELGFTFR